MVHQRHKNWSPSPTGHGGLSSVFFLMIRPIMIKLMLCYFFRMSSANALGSRWTFCQDLDKISIGFVALEKHSRVNRLRTTLTLDNGAPGLQVDSNILKLYFFC